MKKLLNIDLYDEYYSGDELNCINQPIAGLAGGYNYNNYFFYSFYATLFSNWDVKNNNGNYDFLDSRNDILSKFGLELKAERIPNDEDFLKIVKSKINNDSIVMMILRRKALVYELGDIDSSHGVVVSGYDDELSKILLRDAPHVEQSGARYEGRGYGLFKLWMCEELVTRMWSDSNYIHTNEAFKNNIYTIEKTTEPKISSFTDLLDDFIDSYSFVNNVFVQYLTGDTFRLSDFLDDEHSRSVRRWVILPKRVIFDVLSRSAVEIGNGKMENVISDLEKRYMDEHKKIINFLSIEPRRGKYLSEDKKSSIISHIQELDKELSDIVLKIKE